ncbi:phosphatase PAP2 family protein [Bailinhaonella thermotolerans]|uniref:Phosphatase PAP2 family protein n=2 Tax=Bailinhaonella thermotolerans TaxID=1070861 RepID=A0A3A4B6C4_9ACTN|nr:phosphatase PAP2 family protein [Bailinhaonella thermotolerans]
MGGATFGMGRLVAASSAGEPAVMRDIAQVRTPRLNELTDLGSSLSDTPYIVALTAVAAVVLRLVLGRWREPVFLALAVWAQSLVFLATTNLVGRTRPPVPRLDEAPPTSSWPSGHVSAAVCFYCGLALVITLHTRRHALVTALVWVVAAAVPLVVAVSRVYRGMHFITDVTWGLLLGAFCLIVVARAVLFPGPARRAPAPGVPPGRAAAPGASVPGASAPEPGA